MRYLRTTLLLVAAVVPAACEVYTEPPPRYGYGAQVQVQAPPPPQATVDVNTAPPDNGQPPESADESSGDADPSAVDDFRNVLAPYGTWADDPQYGTIWFPSPAVVGSDFTPYLTAGHWAYDQDYTWVSNYDWGWAPFHYGRWFMYPGRGWAWIPGKQYAGAWVTWRNGDDGYGYVGWAPTPPSFYYRGRDVVVVNTPWFEPRYEYAPTADLFTPRIRTRIIRDPARLRVIASRTRPYEVRGGYVTGAGGVRMRVRGPAPTRLGIAERRVTRVQPNARGVARAQEFARSHPPIPRTVRTVTPTHPPLGNVRGTPGRGPTYEQGRVQPGRGDTRGPTYEQGRAQPPQPGRGEARGPTYEQGRAQPPQPGRGEARGPTYEQGRAQPQPQPYRGETRGPMTRPGAPAPSTTTTSARKPTPPPSVMRRGRR